MVSLFAFTGWHYLYSIPLSIVSIFLILVVLVQRGRGGGLTGALGGMGGQSAFGTKAGDLFTKITIVVATIWILLSMLAIQRLGRINVARPSTGTVTTGEDKSQGEKNAEKKPAGGKDESATGATEKGGAAVGTKSKSPKGD